MVRLIVATITGAAENGVSKAMPQLPATLLMLCAVAAMLSMIVFVCGRSSGKYNDKPRPASNVMYYGPGGTGYPANGYPPPAYGAGYPPPYGNPGYAQGKRGGGMGSAATGVAVGAAAGLATGLIIDDIVDGGGGGCGGGGCGGGCGG